MTSLKLPNMPMEAVSVSATIHKKTLYISARFEDTHGKRNDKLLVYSTNKHKWSILPVPQAYSTIAVVNNRITLIGGVNISSSKVIKALFTWYEEEGQWKQELPRMPTGRFIPAVISHDNLLLVTGGLAEDFSTVLNSTDVLDLTTMIWTTSEAFKLPVPLFRHFVVQCRDYIYLVGGRIKALLQKSSDDYNSKAWRTKWSDVKQTTASQHSQPRMSVWTQIADPPDLYPTAVSCAGTLYAVGGYAGGDKVLRGVYAYDTTRNQWVSVGDMSVERSFHCAVPLSNTTIFVGGGYVLNEGKLSHSSSAELLLL